MPGAITNCARSPSQPRHLLGFRVSLVRRGNSPGHITSIIAEDPLCAGHAVENGTETGTGGVRDRSATPAPHPPQRHHGHQNQGPQRCPLPEPRNYERVTLD